MTNNCASCQKPLRSSSIKCSKCDLSFHIVCANASNQSRLNSETKLNWICLPCQNKGAKNITTPVRAEAPSPGEMFKNSTAPSSNKSDQELSTTHSVPSNNNMSDSEILRSLSSEMQLLRGDVGDLKSHIKYLNEHLTQCYSRLDEYDTRIKTLEKREAEIITLNSTIVNLREQLNNQAQFALKNELEISGIDEHKNENPMHIVQVMAYKIGVTIEEQDIDFVTRVGPRRQKAAHS
ncbi:hypothetical protein HF086_002442 [Spodoptera exigua]|uniref:PHD-type domain-containing protein n=1 Tax=Spodoptera exigua TaxID=7107 RepID=A0A922SEZ9_SPOEX|nr:hypothetical protein HF086_002442 [Spodoptera exigua]